MIYAHLNDIKTYKNLECNVDKKIRKHVNHLIPKNNYSLVEEEVGYFNNVSFEGSNFCGLLKIQKVTILTVTVLTARLYNQVISAHLNDKKTYKNLECNIDKKIRKHVNHLVSKNKYCLVEEEVVYFKNVSFEGSNFCGLLKIQKVTILTVTI